MNDDDTWLALGSAVAATGWKAERIRSLARRGTIQRKRGNGRDWLYQITPELVAARADTAADPRADTDEAARWQAAELQEEIAELRERLARAEAGLDAAAAVAEARISAARVETKAVRELADRLTAELADLRRPWWRRFQRLGG